jgi:hypothetical protein
MAVTYSTATKQARLEAVIAKIDAGAGPGTLEIGTASMASVLAVLTLADPSGTASGGTLTFDFDPDISDTSANNSGTAAAAQIKDSDGNVIISGLTVGTSATDIVLDSVSITAGQTVTLTTGTITHA